MFNFIVCDNDVYFLEELKSVINYVASRCNCNRNIFCFNDYDENFWKTSNINFENKIYILDIETPSRSGIDVARIIREKDYKSIIIFVTGYSERYEHSVITNRLSVLGYIDKSNYKDELIDILEKIVTLQIKTENKFSLKYKDITFVIKEEDILFVFSENRKTYIQTEDFKLISPKTMKAFISELDIKLTQTHKACFVNVKRIARIDKKRKMIYFENGIKSNLLSKNYLSKLIKEMNKIISWKTNFSFFLTKKAFFDFTYCKYTKNIIECVLEIYSDS